MKYITFDCDDLMIMLGVVLGDVLLSELSSGSTNTRKKLLSTNYRDRFLIID